MLQVRLGEVGVVEEAREEVRGAAADMPRSSSSMSRRTSPGSHTSIRLHRVVAHQRARKALSIPMKCPTGAPVIGGGPPVGMAAELAGLVADRAVRVDDALGVSRGAGGERDHAPARRGRPAPGLRSASASSTSSNGKAPGGQVVGRGVADHRPRHVEAASASSGSQVAR